jgi:hypothetical protein
MDGFYSRQRRPAPSPGVLDPDGRSLTRPPAGYRSSKWAAVARPGFLSHFNDRLVTDLCGLKAPLTERKPDDDLCSLLPIGIGPQIELGDNGVERLYQEGGCFRLESSSLQHPSYRASPASSLEAPLAAARL